MVLLENPNGDQVDKEGVDEAQEVNPHIVRPVEDHLALSNVVQVRVQFP